MLARVSRRRAMAWVASLAAAGLAIALCPRPDPLRAPAPDLLDAPEEAAAVDLPAGPWAPSDADYARFLLDFERRVAAAFSVPPAVVGVYTNSPEPGPRWVYL